jgi:hypothetical protein
LAGSNGVCLWNAKTAKFVANFGQSVTQMALSADCKLVVTIEARSDDIRFYDIPVLPKDE